MENLETKNKDRGAFACVDPTYVQDGLTKREYFAGLAMQGLMTSQNSEGEWRHSIIDAAKISVKMADELLKQLES